MTYSSIRYYLLLSLTVLLMACSSSPSDVQTVDALPDIYPDYVGVTIPVGIAPLNFSMADDSVSTVDVEVRGAKQGSLHANGSYADFDIDEWHQLLEDNKGTHLELTVCAEKDGQWRRYHTFRIYVSPYAFSDWGVTYRRVAPGYGMYCQMGLYQRDLSTFEETPMLINTQISGMCINCHTANRGNPEQYTFHVRGEHGATVIHRDGKDFVLKASNDSLGGSMVYPYWHPDGRYCAYSTNSTRQMFHLAQNKRIEVFDSKSDVFVFDTETNTVLRDTLTMRKNWSENCPAFSPDGKWLYFVTSPCRQYPEEFDKVKYSLCRVSFDAQKAHFGEQVDTLINARLTGKSVTWPRLSYDGRYLMYTLIDYGYFSIWHPEADLWLMDLQTGEQRPMDEVNTARAESLHNWSTDSRWFLFNSRREDGLYSRLYFSSIGADGKATKPFLLPQRNPKWYYAQSLYSFNTPDFANRPVAAHAQELGIRIESDERIEPSSKNISK